MLVVGREQRQDDLLVVFRHTIGLQIIDGRLTGNQSDGTNSHHNDEHKHQDEAQAQTVPQHREMSKETTQHHPSS